MSRSRVVRTLVAAVLGVACLVAAPGCGSKINDDNYGKIKAGMSETEVRNILGNPASTEKGAMGAASKEVWKDGGKTITVLFVEDKVLASEKSGF